jgi:Zn-dependent protease
MSGAESGSALYWILGILAAVLLFGSVLIHELAHSLIARSRGLRVDNITLIIFGGVSNITREPSRARDEFLVAIVGPLSSFVLAVLFWAVSLLAPNASALDAVLGYLASANLLLALFNIVPGFPLDGGRVLRSIIWSISGSATHATQIASYVGQAVAFALIAWGVLRLVGGDVSGGVWIAFIGCS